jgi:hypothetical protein
MAFVKTSMTQNQTLVTFLRGKNRGLTAPQARALFGIGNLRARMSELRQEGYRIRTAQNKSGRTVYFISRRMAWQS